MQCDTDSFKNKGINSFFKKNKLWDKRDSQQDKSAANISVEWSIQPIIATWLEGPAQTLQ